MNVEWADSALTDIERIVAYLKPLNPFAARQLARKLFTAGDSLTTFPHRGRPGLAAGTRELVIVRPYLMVYEVDDAAGLVRILRVWHGAQNR
ncbi:MAG: type II toxin-antitoxin system RelE/ParE family toxin, partial [Acetobacteraceae bacterium]|nr:type II toxin-antitoxin system RelE/ParE family toxin [Acetobacteraceae bacterium]